MFVCDEMYSLVGRGIPKATAGNPTDRTDSPVYIQAKPPCTTHLHESKTARLPCFTARAVGWNSKPPSASSAGASPRRLRETRQTAPSCPGKFGAGQDTTKCAQFWNCTVAPPCCPNLQTVSLRSRAWQPSCFLGLHTVLHPTQHDTTTTMWLQLNSCCANDTLMECESHTQSEHKVCVLHQP